jgi:hypothetical protein
MALPLLATVLSNTFTVTSVRRRLALLKEFLEQTLFGSGEHILRKEALAVFFENRPEDASDVAALLQWGDDFLSVFTKENVYDKLRALQEQVSGVPVLTLYTAVPFPLKELRELSERIRTLINGVVLIDDKVDESLSAGSTFVWDGVRHDHSLEKRFNGQHEALRKLVFEHGTEPTRT